MRRHIIACAAVEFCAILREWLADILLGPACPLCTHPARGPRSLITHIERGHAA